MSADTVRDPRLDFDPDFILMKRFQYSLAKLIERFPEGADDSIIAQALGISPSEVEPLYQSVILKLREKMQENNVESIVL